MSSVTLEGARVGSMFSGYDGIGLALAQRGARPAWFAEVMPAANRVLAHHWPEVPNLGDVSAVEWGSVPPVDVITAGFPCQDVSLAGRRAGLREGTRSGLWVAVADAIEALQPRLVVIENVRGLLSAGAGNGDVEPCPWCLGDHGNEHPLRALGAVLGDLARLGFHARWGGFRASDAGAPHGRFRVFIVAWPRHATHPPGVGSERGRGHHETGIPAAENHRAAVGHPHGGGLAGNPARGAEPAPGHEPDRSHHGPVAHTDLDGFGQGADPGEAAAGWEDPNRPRVVPQTNRVTPPPPPPLVVAPGGILLKTPTANLATNGGSQPPAKRRAGNHRPTLADELEHDLLPTPTVALATGGATSRGHDRSGEVLLGGDVDWRHYAPVIARWAAILGRTPPPPTLPTGRGGAHRLNPVFVEWMMGLPPGHVTDPAIGLTRGQQLTLLGNGVVPLQLTYALHMMAI